MHLKTENLQAFRNRKGWHSPQSLSSLVFFGEGGKDVSAGEWDPQVKTHTETLRPAKQQHSPIPWAVSVIPSTHIEFFPIFPLKLQSKTHCRCDIIFPDNWTLRVNDFPSFSRGNNFVLLNVIFYYSPLCSPLWPKAQFQRSSASSTQLHGGSIIVGVILFCELCSNGLPQPTWWSPRDIFFNTKGRPGDTARQCGRKRYMTDGNRRTASCSKAAYPEVPWSSGRGWETWVPWFRLLALPESHARSGILFSFKRTTLLPRGNLKHMRTSSDGPWLPWNDVNRLLSKWEEQF